MSPLFFSSSHYLFKQDIRNQERKRKGLEVLNEPLQTGLEYEEEREKLHASFTPASQTSGTGELPM